MSKGKDANPQPVRKPVDPGKQPAVRGKDHTPPGQERTALRNRLRALGYTNAEANALIKDGITLGEMREAVVGLQRQA